MDYANQNELNQVANSPLKFNSIISDSVGMECEKLKEVLSIDDSVVVEFNLKNGFYNLLDFLREVKINTNQYKLIVSDMNEVNIESMICINDYISRKFECIFMYFVFSCCNLRREQLDFIINNTNPFFLNKNGSAIVSPEKTSKGSIYWLDDEHLGLESGNIKLIHKGLHKAIGFISDNYDKDISLSDVARHSCVSSSHLSYLFRRFLNTTFKNVLYMIRLNNAKKIITSNPSLTITKVASDVGFYDLSHFSKVWKKFNSEPFKNFKYNKRKLSLSGGGGA